MRKQVKNTLTGLKQKLLPVSLVWKSVSFNRNRAICLLSLLFSTQIRKAKKAEVNSEWRKKPTPHRSPKITVLLVLPVWPVPAVP